MRIALPMSPAIRMFAGFAVYAFSLGNLFPRLPDIKAHLGVEEGALGLGLIGAPVGTLIALTFATPLLERIGFRMALLIAIPLIPFFDMFAVAAPTPLALFLLLIPVGLMIGCTEIILNVEADRTEFKLGKRIMNRAHSFWSAGFFGAGLFGAWMAQLDISTPIHMAIVVAVSLVGTILIFGDYQPAPKRPEDTTGAAPLIARPTGPILILVVVTLSAMLLEGASMDWSAIYMKSIFDSEPFVAGFAVAIFAFFHFATRFFADGFIEKHSPALVARVQCVFMAIGIAIVYFSPSPIISLIGFGVLGVGSSSIFPLAISAAAQRTDRPASINVAALAQISFVVFLLGPPLLGFVAEHWGLRWTYGLGLPLVILSFVTAGSLGGKPPRT